MSAPEFAEAEQAFRAFLKREGWPTEIIWVRAQDVRRGRPILVYRSAEEDAGAVERHYEEGRRRGLGVQLEAVCTVAGATCATVNIPADAREAEELMFPGDGGLKLSLDIPRTEGEVRWPVC